MSYRIQVAGKIFEGNNPQTLLKRAVEARREWLKQRMPRSASDRSTIHSERAVRGLICLR